MTGRARAVAFGSGSFAVPVLDALVGHPRVDLAAVVTAPPRPAGRRAELVPTPVAVRAASLGLPILTPARLRDAEALDAVAALVPDLIVLADYGRIVPGAILDLPPHGALNLHPSLLPRHRGAAPIPAAILAGDAETGVSLMRMDEGMDTGPVVAQDRYALDGTETSPELEAVLARRAATLLADVLGDWLDGRRQPFPQDEAAATLTRPLRREDGWLDHRRPAAQLERQVRALQPWPGTYLETDTGRLVVHRAAVGEPLAGGRTPGTLHARPDGALALVTADGELLLREVQPAGGRRMTVDALLRGRPALAGSAVRMPPGAASGPPG